MPKTTGIPDYFFVADSDISGDVAAVTNVRGGPTELNMTGIDKAAFERLAGIFDGEIGFNVMFNVDLGKEHEELSALPYTDILVSYFRDKIIGNPAACMMAKQIDYNWNREQTGMLLGNVRCVAGPTGLGLEWCEQLTAGKVTHAAATNETAVDGLAATAYGCSVYHHAFSVATGTAANVIQDSADNVSFAAITGITLASSTNATHIGQRANTTATQAIRRYVRFITTGTFTNAVLAAAFIRYVTPATLRAF